MVNFTPGPWHVEAGAVWAEAADGSNLKIAQPLVVLNYVSMAECNANANFIAAGPTTHNALKKAKEFIENQQLPDAEWSRVLDIVVAALAQAEGKAASNAQ